MKKYASLTGRVGLHGTGDQGENFGSGENADKGTVLSLWRARGKFRSSPQLN